MTHGAQGVSLRVGTRMQGIARMQCDARGGRVVKCGGDAVNAASRIEAAAGPGQVVLSAGAYRLAPQQPVR